MEIFQYILDGLGTYLGTSSVMLGFVLIASFMLLAMRFGLNGYPLFVVFFLITTISITGYLLTSYLLIYSLLIVAGLFGGAIWLIMNR